MKTPIISDYAVLHQFLWIMEKNYNVAGVTTQIEEPVKILIEDLPELVLCPMPRVSQQEVTITFKKKEV
jgi:hypothetical protein